jgi:hypothetical protein
VRFRGRGYRGRLIFIAALVALTLAAPAAQAAGPPKLIGGYASNVESTKAILNVAVNPEGLATNYRFEYTTEAKFLSDGFDGATVTPPGGEAIGSGSAPLSRSRAIGSLTPATAYRYRIVATNSAGTTTGLPRLLSTDAVGLPFSLPDGRAWEMVSPVDKNDGEIQGFEANFGGDVLQASPDGNTVTFSSRSSFAAPQGAPGASQYIARRQEGSGWATTNITAPTEAGAYGDQPDGVPFQLFSTDLGAALMLNGCLPQPCPRSYARRSNNGGVLSTIPLAALDLDFAGASPDLSQLLFTTAGSLYDFSGGQVRQINDLPGPAAALAARRGAVSEDGSRIYWTTASDLYLREGQSSLPVATAAEFQSAGADGRFAFYVKGEHLFRYDAVSHLSDEYTLAGGGLLGFLGASEDGESFYYAGLDGALYLHRGAEDTLVAASVAPGSYPPAISSARVGADGGRLLFISSAEATPYDNRNQKSGVSEPEVYLYEAAPGPGQGTLTCVSCNPSGERPIGPASLPGTIANGSGEAATRAYRPRVLSAGAHRVFFDSFDALGPKDTNQDRDVYQWEAPGTGSCAKPTGCIDLISSGTAEGGATLIDASADGADAFFLTDGSLVGTDPPNSGKVDLYDARVGGGFPTPPDPPECVGDDCQPLPPEPEDPTPGSLQPDESNPPLRKACRKGTVRKKGKCVRRRHEKKHHATHRGSQK